MAYILAALQAIPAALALFKGIMGVVRQIQQIFQKSPAQEQAKEEEKHSDSQKKTEGEDNTDGAFGG